MKERKRVIGNGFLTSEDSLCDYSVKSNKKFKKIIESATYLSSDWHTATYIVPGKRRYAQTKRHTATYLPSGKRRFQSMENPGFRAFLRLTIRGMKRKETKATKNARGYRASGVFVSASDYSRRPGVVSTIS